jgi:hypothetical protein
MEKRTPISTRYTGVRQALRFLLQRGSMNAFYTRATTLGNSGLP